MRHISRDEERRPLVSSGNVNVLVVDDEEDVRGVLVRTLGSCGYEVREAASAEEGLEMLSTTAFHLVLTDVKMPGMDGIEFLRRARASSPDLPVIVVTAFASVDSAVEAMKSGARDYITKPFSTDEVRLRVERILNEQWLMRENRSLREALKQGYDIGRGARLIGTSPSMRSVFETIAQVSRNESNVLVQGETGTGKELVARAIHYSGQRADKPFVALNCGSVSKTLLESQLFGHVRGAFTGAVRDNPGFFVAAEGGTLFLDEITEVDTDTQVKLLRAVQEREVTPVGGTKPVRFDVRIVSATNRDAERAVKEGVLRSDLYYRLSVVEIELPPLRERREDIRALVDYFNARFSEKYGIAPRKVSKQAIELLEHYDWPGNARQLENVIERAFALGQGPLIEAADLPLKIAQGAGEAGSAGDERPQETRTLEANERAAVLRALEEADGVKAKAAQLLGVSRKVLYRLLHKHDLI